MTEQEIINYLKENKNKGVAFAFMPEEVKIWCKEHRYERYYVYENGIWAGIGIGVRMLYYSDKIYSLPEDYEPKHEFEPHWVEFEVNEDGCFHDDGDLPCKWYRWFDFLNCNADRYNNFGGWLYVDSDKKPTWYMSPRIDGDGRVYSYSPIDVESKPAIPKKVRFWRYAE